MEASSAVTPGWADAGTGLIYVFMIKRAAISGNPDNSRMRQAYERVVAAGAGR